MPECPHVPTLHGQTLEFGPPFRPMSLNQFFGRHSYAVDKPTSFFDGISFELIHFDCVAVNKG